LQKNREFIKELHKRNENKHKNQEEQFRCKQNVENIYVLKHQYKNNLERNRFKRRREQDDLENKRAKKRYEKDSENQGVQHHIRYRKTNKIDKNYQSVNVVIIDNIIKKKERKEKK